MRNYSYGSLTAVRESDANDADTELNTEDVIAEAAAEDAAAAPAIADYTQETAAAPAVNTEEHAAALEKVKVAQTSYRAARAALQAANKVFHQCSHYAASAQKASRNKVDNEDLFANAEQATSASTAAGAKVKAALEVSATAKKALRDAQRALTDARSAASEAPAAEDAAATAAGATVAAESAVSTAPAVVAPNVAAVVAHIHDGDRGDGERDLRLIVTSVQAIQRLLESMVDRLALAFPQ